MSTDFAPTAPSGMSPDFSVAHVTPPRIEWVNEELKRVDFEMRALAYTTMFSIIGIVVASALLYVI